MSTGSSNELMTRRRFVARGGAAVAGAGLLSGLTAACGGGSNMTTITWWDTDVLGPNAPKQFKEMFQDPFRRSDPTIDLKIDFKPNALNSGALTTALAAGAGPDLIETAPTYAIQLYKGKRVLDLSKYADDFEWSKKMLPWALESGKIHGGLYSVPLQQETMVLWYNKTLFEDKGWKPPTTRDELEAIAQDATSQGIIPFSSGNAEWRPAPGWLVSVFFNRVAGPRAWHDALTGRITFADPLFVESIALLQSYFQKGWFAGGVDQYFTNKFATIYSLLGKGKAAMDMEGTWAASDMSDNFGPKAGNSNEWDWAPLPSLRSGVPYPIFDLSVGNAIAVNRVTKSPDACAKFIDWMFSDPQKRVVRWIANYGSVTLGSFVLPLRLDKLTFPSSVDPRIARVFQTLSKQASLRHIGYTSWSALGPKSDTYSYKAMEKVLTGHMSPKEYCDGLASVFTSELKQGLVPPAPAPA